MKRSILLFLFFPAFLFGGEHTIFVNGHLNYARLFFEDSPKVRGYLAGPQIGYEYQHCRFFTDVAFEGYFNAGPLCGRFAQESKVRDYYANWRIGPSFCLCCDKLQLNPYLGFGFERFLNMQDPRVDGLTYKYTKLFVPIGVKGYWCVHEQVTMGLEAEFRPDVFARVRFCSNKIDIDRKYAARLQLPLMLHIGCQETVSLNLIPFFDWNKFGQADECTCNGIPLPIPDLTRWYAGFKVELAFTF